MKEIPASQAHGPNGTMRCISILAMPVTFPMIPHKLNMARMGMRSKSGHLHLKRTAFKCSRLVFTYYIFTRFKYWLISAFSWFLKNILKLPKITAPLLKRHFILNFTNSPHYLTNHPLPYNWNPLNPTVNHIQNPKIDPHRGFRNLIANPFNDRVNEHATVIICRHNDFCFQEIQQRSNWLYRIIPGLCFKLGDIPSPLHHSIYNGDDIMCVLSELHDCPLVIN